MRVLFVHQNFPGQYKHLAPALAARPENEVVALAISDSPPMAGVTLQRYQVTRGNASGIHPFLGDFESKVIRGEAAARAALDLKAGGFAPDLICAHPGWGEALFLKEVFPDAPMLSFIEFHYRHKGADFRFDPEYADNSIESACRLRIKNAGNLLSLDICDWAVTPTAWQKSSIPSVYHSKVSVIHDGIDTALVRPNPAASVTLQRAGISLRPGDEVITFVNRNLEPYRGFHTFMRALPEIQRRRPRVWVIIVGGDEVSYGKQLAPGETYRQKLLAEVGEAIDLDRIRFVGRVSYPDFLRMLQVSGVHVYLTYPFVLSWSCLEAMAAGCALVASATPPVEEVIRDGENGLLVDFFSPAAIADAVDRVLDHPDRMRAMRERARQTIVDRYDLKRVCLPRHLALAEAVAGRQLPPRLPTRSAPESAIKAPKPVAAVRQGGRRRRR